MFGLDRDRDDARLLAAWRAGDGGARAALIERHYAGIARFFASRLDGDYEDLIQATFLGCIEAIERFRGDASFRSLLFAIARNKLYKHLRERERDRRRFSPVEATLEADAPSAISLVLASCEEQRLFAALLRLSPDTRRLFELHYWGNLTIREIAEDLEMPIGTVKIRMHRARRRIAAELGDGELGLRA